MSYFNIPKRNDVKYVNLADIEKVQAFYVPGPLRVNPRILSHGQLFMLYNIGSQTVTQKSQIGTILACFSAQRRVSRQPVVRIFPLDGVV